MNTFLKKKNEAIQKIELEKGKKNYSPQRVAFYALDAIDAHRMIILNAVLREEYDGLEIDIKSAQSIFDDILAELPKLREAE